MKKELQTVQLTERARTGSFIIIPMLPEGKDCSFRRIANRFSIDTPDISLNVLETLNREGYVVQCWKIAAESVNRGMFGGRNDYTLILDGRDENRLEIGDIFIFEFHTGIILVGISILYSKMEMMQRICYPGYARGDCRYSFRGEDEGILLEDRLKEWLGTIGLLPFYDDSPLFLEAFIHNVAVVPQRFRKMKEITEITFNMHLMAPLDQNVTDASEEDVSYVYAVKDQVMGSYRWGCCISSQTISYVICDEAMNLKREMEIESRDTLPVVVLALYEKYTCLYFDRLLAEGSRKRVREIKELRRRMLEFKAYGTVTPSSLSRWYNIRMIYKRLVEYFGVLEVLSEINSKLEILSNAQKEIEDKRRDILVDAITFFGLISILDSVLSIYVTLSTGTEGVLRLFLLCVAAFAVIFAAMILFIRHYR